MLRSDPSCFSRNKELMVIPQNPRHVRRFSKVLDFSLRRLHTTFHNQSLINDRAGERLNPSLIKNVENVVQKLTKASTLPILRTHASIPTLSIKPVGIIIDKEGLKHGFSRLVTYWPPSTPG